MRIISKPAEVIRTHDLAPTLSIHNSQFAIHNSERPFLLQSLDIHLTVSSL